MAIDNATLLKQQQDAMEASLQMQQQMQQMNQDFTVKSTVANSSAAAREKAVADSRFRPQ